ncbi:MAG: N-acetylmuramoyl-L-alanine amidase [Chryseobacterium sp.]|nr:MAG: N-acetylmuramoyl-L-alanine amidase [Chryseobacterium sp.]
MRNILYIIFHCTGANPKQTVESIKNYWKMPEPKGKGWKQVGYHHLVDFYGVDHQLATDDKITNGVAGFNSNAIHISYIGGENWKDTRTAEQKVTLEKLARYYHAKYPKAKIKGHRDFSPDKNGDGKIDPSEYMKFCPAFEVSTWIKELGL